MENPPLWVWAIVVGAIIASKFVYRWQVTKQFAKEAQEKRRNINSDQKQQTLVIMICMTTEDISQIYDLTNTVLGVFIKITLQ